ncbi:hypothetical protein [Stratiformator vulcanicus]|uniref:Uncharacterized protein n=1 Tax=Stratiformator vulcanicus TaxID=2527980 RepID=A0A517QY60_9PLAN|nr:hypothetical protein [Stratiformator vulcanicus]QDT36589.1 hypothetical protein Pan189_09490 [Stratiformator vulcanicus]
MPVLTRLRWQLFGELRAELRREHAELMETVQNISGSIRGMSHRFDQVENRQEISLRHLSQVEAYAQATAQRFVINCGDDGLLVRTAVGYLFCDSKDSQLIACLLEN